MIAPLIIVLLAIDVERCTSLELAIQFALTPPASAGPAIGEFVNTLTEYHYMKTQFDNKCLKMSNIDGSLFAYLHIFFTDINEYSIEKTDGDLQQILNN